MIRLIGYFFGIGTTLALLVAGGVALYIGNLAKDLPDYEVLAKYEPPVTTRVHAVRRRADGRVRARAAPLSADPGRAGPRQGGLPVGRGQEFLQPSRHRRDRPWPRRPHQSAEHGSGRRQVGASTITQQVAKNFLLTSNQTYERKIKEMLLAFRIEQAYSKDRILELYLNEIFFGLGAYGIAGAALTYFDKSVNELTVAEAAYLAALPKGPSNYHPFKLRPSAPIERRNWVIGQMVENGYVTREEGEKAKAEPLGVAPRRNGTYLFAGEYFTEEVRREIIARYGEDALYEGGLSVRTTLDPKLQLDRPQGDAERPDEIRHAARLSRPGEDDRRVRRLGRAAGRRQAAGRRARMAPRRRARRVDDRPVGRPAAGRGDFRRARQASARRHRQPRRT